METQSVDKSDQLFFTVAPALVLLAVIVPYLNAHQYELLKPESLVLIVGALVIGVAAGWIAKSPLATGIASLVLTVAVVGSLGLHGRAFILLLVSSQLVSAALLWILWRSLAKLASISSAAIIVASFILPTTIVAEPVRTGETPRDLNNLPPIVHIILDEHIGVAGIDEAIPGAEAAADNVKTTYKDFLLYDRAYSRFAETELSLTSLLNAEFGPDVASLIAGAPGEKRPVANTWFELLKSKGYSIRTYQSTHYRMCDGDIRSSFCYTYPVYSTNALQRSGASWLNRLRVIVSDMLSLSLLPSEILSPLAAVEALQEFLSDLTHYRRGVAYVVHLLLPHFPYMYGADCTISDPEDWKEAWRSGAWQRDDATLNSAAERRVRYTLYLAQLKCTSKLIQHALAEMKRIGVYSDATIIVHGDHGSRIGERFFRGATPHSLTERDLIDHYSTLLAVKSPAISPGTEPEPVLLQAQFARHFLKDPEQVGDVKGVFVGGATHGFNFRTLSWPIASDLK